VIARAFLACIVLAACAGDAEIARPTTPRVAPDPPAPDALRRRILDSLGLRAGMTLAEIGLGQGWFVFRAAQALGQSGHVYATDIDREAIAALERELPRIDPAAAPVTVRLCSGPRDTALDDLPDGRLDVILMVDSLCFDGRWATRAEDVAYLGRFARLLRPGGRLVHHMDCNCNVSPEEVASLFRDAGFVAQYETVDVRLEPSSLCRTAEARARYVWVGVFRL
jgi:cyclopropane fatty-acyl-phospholipid synthase-like methyltransferase